MLESACANLLGRRHALALGRGSWAIALVLQALGGPRRRIALPSFLCQTPLAAVLYAGWTPVFCDVDPATGLVPDSEWRKALALGVDAVLFVHLFGNPADPRSIAGACKAGGVFFIEDACQALGASIGGRLCGSHGDASILSFGHTKQVDAGTGGMLLTDDAALAAAVAEAARRHAYPPAARQAGLEAEISSLYYQRKDRVAAGEPPAEAFAGVIERYTAVVPAAWQADALDIAARIAKLKDTTAERVRKAVLYTKHLAGSGSVPIGMGADAAPWRYCLRVPGIDRARQERISGSLRAGNVHVSNWYLPTHWMTRRPEVAGEGLAGTERLAEEVFQFWLDEATDDARIASNAAAFRAAVLA